MNYRNAMRAAKREGAKAGKASASWFFDGNTTDATYARVIKGIDECDPEIMDTLPMLDLSGQWADGATVEDVLAKCDAEDCDDDSIDDVVNAFRDAHDLAVLTEITRIARPYTTQDA